MKIPASVTPRSGTKSSSIRWSTANEKVSVPTRIASVTFSMRSRNQSRIMRAENVPIAIWTTSTVTVTTKPVSAAAAPMIAVSNVLAVEGEYCHRDAVPMCSSATRDADSENPPERGSDYGDEPEALEQAFAPTEPPGPRHLAATSSARGRERHISSTSGSVHVPSNSGAVGL